MVAHTHTLAIQTSSIDRLLHNCHIDINRCLFGESATTAHTLFRSHTHTHTDTLNDMRNAESSEVEANGRPQRKFNIHSFTK